MKRYLLLFLSLFIASQANAQTPSTSTSISNSFKKQNDLQKSSAFLNFPTRNVGPVVMGGRIVDFAVTSNPKKYYAAFSSAGVYVTTNFGASFEPIFDHQDGIGIGDIAVSASNESIIWVGTGENNSSRSSYAGSGVYKSLDEGKTWESVGLTSSHHIGRIIIHPTNPEIVWVGSMGPLYSIGGERGLYKTTDGGKTWNRTLFVDDSTGVIDIKIHPTNPNILWASTWQRHRAAWDFKEDGKGSAIWKSVDAGETWQKSISGFPQGDFVGRIGLDVSLSNPDIVYAIVDNQEIVKTEIKKDKEKLYQADFVSMSKTDFLKVDSKKLEAFLRSNGFPKEISAESVSKDVKNNVFNPSALSDYLGGNANDALFNTSIKGAEVYRSEDGGKSWKITHSKPVDGLYFTYGYYFGEIFADPNDSNTIYVLGVPVLKSTDAGKNWTRVDGGDVHVDHHALWINPADSKHLLLGNDGGIYSTFDGGTHWTHHNSIPSGQFYTVNIDYQKPYSIYGGLQDNGIFTGSSKSVPNESEYWKRLLGGDGMHIAVNPKNPEWVYGGFQFGNYYRINRTTKEFTPITPKHKMGSKPYRFNWNTPVVLSPHNPDVIYMGSEKVMRSMNQGTDFTEISPDLTKNKPNTGNVPYSTITSISESPFEFGLIWVGTDDGQIQVTENGGASWTLTSSNLPENLWVSKVVASPHDRNTAYATLTGYRFDHFDAYAYITKDLGKTWTKVSDGLPSQALNVLIPDSENPNLLFVGSDHGGFMSFDEGKTWQSFPISIPNVAVYDLIIQPTEGELVIGTHGRSIYVLDIKPIRELLKAGLNTDLYAYKPNSVMKSNRWGQQSYSYSEMSKPSVDFSFYSSKAGKVIVNFIQADKKSAHKVEIEAKSGFNTFTWDLIVSEKNGKTQFLDVGVYSINYKMGKAEQTVEFEIKKRN